jgi:putative MATE family efflux protein
LMITGLVVIFGPSLLSRFMSSKEICQASSTFLVYRVLGLLFASGGMLFRAFYTGITFTRYLSISSAIMAVVNVILDYVLIFGHWGFSKMGIAGAGIASTIAEASALLFFLIVTWHNRKVKDYDLFRWVRPQIAVIKSTLGVSVFVMMQMVLSLGCWFIFFMFIEKLGERPLAVSNIIRSLYLLLMIPGWALCSVTNTLVSNTLGEGNPDFVIPVVKKMVKFCAVCMVVVLSLAALIPRYAISIYTNDASLIEATVPSYYIIIVALFIFAMVSILFNGVLGTGNTNVSFGIEAITLTAYLTFAWFVAVHLHLKIEQVWTSEFVYSLILGTLSYWYLKKGEWRGKII